MTLVFAAVKLDWKVRSGGAGLNARQVRLEVSRKAIVPAIVRTAPEPAPNRSTASSAARFIRGWWVSPR